MKDGEKKLQLAGEETDKEELEKANGGGKEKLGGGRVAQQDQRLPLT